MHLKIFVCLLVLKRKSPYLLPDSIIQYLKVSELGGEGIVRKEQFVKTKGVNYPILGNFYTELFLFLIIIIFSEPFQSQACPGYSSFPWAPLGALSFQGTTQGPIPLPSPQSATLAMATVSF